MFGPNWNNENYAINRRRLRKSLHRMENPSSDDGGEQGIILRGIKELLSK